MGELLDQVRGFGLEFSPQQIEKTFALYAPHIVRPTPDVAKVTRDVQYGPDERNRLDIFAPAGGASGAPVLVYVHGGGFVAGSPEINAANVLPACHLSGCPGLGVDYTLLPRAYFPAQIDELDKIYAALIKDDPDRRIVMLSDSTGAAISLAAMMRWRTNGLKAPAGAVFLSPCIDGDGASDTQITADHHDPLIRSMGGKFTRQLFHFYAPDRDRKDPAVSPIYGDFSYLPPMLVHAGSREVLLGDAARLSEAARRAGVETHLRVFDGMFHRFHMHWKLDETRAAHADIADFIRTL